MFHSKKVMSIKYIKQSSWGFRQQCVRMDLRSCNVQQRTRNHVVSKCTGCCQNPRPGMQRRKYPQAPDCDKQGGSLQLHLQCTQDFVIMLVITESHICYPHSNNTMNKNTHMWGPAFDPLYHKLICKGNKVERWSVFEVKIVEKFNWHICLWDFRSFEGMEKNVG